MEFEKYTKKSFVLLGMEGSVHGDPIIILKLWKYANLRHERIEQYIIRNEEGKIDGVWGAKSDFSYSFKPWENNHTEGVYLAGVECVEDAEPPRGWDKWIMPGYEYIKVECVEDDNLFNEMTFNEAMQYFDENSIEVIASVQEYTDLKTRKNYLLFPIKELKD